MLDGNIIYGPAGLHFSKFTVQQNGWPLGTQLNYPDGRKYRFFKNNASNATIAGNLQTSQLPVANNSGLAVTATPIGATSLAVTLGGGTTAAGQYDDGFAMITDVTGEGYSYHLATGQPASVSTALTVNLASSDPIVIALTASSIVTLVKNPYDQILIAATTPGAPIAGCAVSAVAANGFGFVQTAGAGVVLTDGTLIAGNIGVPSTAAAGGVMAAINDLLPPVCVVQRISATTDFSPVKFFGMD